MNTAYRFETIGICAARGVAAPNGQKPTDLRMPWSGTSHIRPGTQEVRT